MWRTEGGFLLWPQNVVSVIRIYKSVHPTVSIICWRVTGKDILLDILFSDFRPRKLLFLRIWNCFNDHVVGNCIVWDAKWEVLLDLLNNNHIQLVERSVGQSLTRTIDPSAQLKPDFLKPNVITAENVLVPKLFMRDVNDAETDNAIIFRPEGSICIFDC